MLGAVSVLPYIFEVFSKVESAQADTQPTLLVIAMQILHLTLIFGVTTGIGLLLAQKVGIALPFLERWLNRTPNATPIPDAVRNSIVAGLAVGGFMTLALYGFVLPGLPQFPSETSIPIWKRFLLCIYTGIDVELLMRLFLLSLVLWILQKLFRKPARSSAALFWVGNSIVALIFGAAYLPAIGAFVPLTAPLIASILLLAGASGLVFGKLCWSYGLEAAMIAHFVSDLVVHLIGPLFARSP